MYYAHSGTAVYCFAGIAVSALFDANQAVRQRTGVCVDLAEGKMQELWAAYFSDVSAGRASDRAVVRELLPGVCDFTGHR